MLTFGNAPGLNSAEGDELFPDNLPDEIECGENNDYWIRVVRSTKRVELVSKQTGAVVVRAEVPKDGSILAGLSPAQMSAVRSALKL